MLPNITIIASSDILMIFLCLKKLFIYNPIKNKLTTANNLESPVVRG